MRLVGAVYTTLLVAGLGPAWGQAAQPDALDSAVRSLLDAYNAGDVAAFRRDFSEAMLDALSAEQSAVLMEGMKAELGRAEDIGPRREDPTGGGAVFPVRFERGLLDVTVHLDGQGKIAGLWLRPHRPPIPVPERHRTAFSLPFAGRWKVVWGGDDEAHNIHHPVLSQRYAFDFVMTDDQGSTHRGSGRANEDYYCFGREILAPADGLVVDVITGVRDNLPGSMNPFSAVGNAVVIKHRPHEYSMMAHLKFGSIRVSVGQTVKRGQVIGLCGNSGNSSEPHLHFQVMNTPVLQDATSLKCYFLAVSVTHGDKTEVRTDYSPVMGDLVARAGNCRRRIRNGG
ncbi:MAG: peptidoglycan DD-metalloendopeptidase family protein [Armatimonadetes bacterium]|nr:peptidoglycan DD-metalloendopeptidase family protein [Armatimonadota bacterium]